MDFNQGNTRKPSPGTKGGRARSKSANPSQGLSFAISRGPMGPHSRRPFSRGGGSAKVSMDIDPFASDDESPQVSTVAPYQHAPQMNYGGAYPKKYQEFKNQNWREKRGGQNIGRERDKKHINKNAGVRDHRSEDRAPRDKRNEDNGDRRERVPRVQKYALGFKKLEEFLTGSPEDVLIKLLENSGAFTLLLEKKDLSADCICLVLQAMAKLAESYFDQHKLKLLHIVTNEAFMSQLIAFIAQLLLQDNKDKKRAQYFWNNPVNFFSDLHKFCEMVLKVLPTTAINILPKLLKAVSFVIPHLDIGNDIHQLYENLQTKLLVTIEDWEIKKQKGENMKSIEDELEPPDNFREINVFPLPYEIVTWESPFLRENKIKGAYKSVEEYLDIQFRLVRNDFVKPLRDGICTFLDKEKKKKVQNIKIHNGVTFIKAEMCSSAANGFLIQLPTQKNKRFQMKLENSRVFMYGSLVCFTKDNFKTILFGRIVERKIELLKEGRLIIAIHSGPEKIDLNAKYTMIECKVYFEPYFYVLSALKEIDEDDFPMKEYIIDMQAVAAVPNYYLENTQQIIGKYRIPIVNGLINRYSWPSAGNLELNEAQYEAYINALSRKFAIIQGPPGTGKTHLGLKVAKALLFNAAVWHKKESPMLVICFTNHALDQFLEGLLSTTNEIVRIGGQSKNKKLDQYNIRCIRSKSHNHLVQDHQYAVKQSAYTLKRLYDLLEATRAFEGVVYLQPLLDKLPEVKQSSLLYSNEDFTKWLFGGTVHRNFNELDKSNLFTQPNTKELADNNDEEDEAIFKEVFEMFDTDDHKLEDDILGLKYVGASVHMITLDNYKSSLEYLHKQATLLKNLKDEADPREWQKLQVQYAEKTFQHDYLEAALEEGKKIKNPQPPRDMEELLKNPYNIPPEERWQLYFYWVKMYETEILKSIAEEEVLYQKVYKEFEDVKMLRDIEVLRTKLVVGMTTTSAARLQSVLRALRSRIVIVEEAAEIMEAHIVTALTKHCDHLILIGDHQQLRPSTADYMMETKYKLGISLFERMVRNDVHRNILEIQHRMRPEFSKLIVPTIYPVLHDHESVLQFQPIRGVDRNLFFIDHKNAENSETDESKFNMHEVKYLINLAQYLILNGYGPEDITILCAYSAQLFKMFNERKKYPMLQAVRISVLDNFQGEESKIILLSLVRNNNEGKVGFLKIDNRICVALSRAREGFYIMGNMDMLVKASPIWEEIKKTLESQNSLGPALPLRCQIHRYKITEIKTTEDFQKVAEGGCDEMCNQLLLCGHICKTQCHIMNRDHSESSCREQCLQILCTDGHGCPKMCYEKCDPCMFLMTRHLKCGHTGDYPCHDKKPNCHDVITAKLPCGHEAKKLCYLPLENVICPHPCDTRIEKCGHACVLKCHINKDPDHLEYKCQKTCGKIRPNCLLNVDDHRCTKCCYEECDECDIVVRKLRSCSHMFPMRCSESVELMHCSKPCKRQLPCDHKCRQECGDTCGNCLVKVDKQVPECGHVIKIFCKDTPTKTNCTGPCILKLPCGHLCQNKCKDPCTKKCEALTSSVMPLACGHHADIPCSQNKADTIDGDTSLLKYCKKACTKMLKCDHLCSGTCGECYQGRIHKACSSDCGVSLVCGHICKTPCRQVCPPCNQICEFRCAHSKCKKKCGEPCTPCQERCTRRCVHQLCPKICSDICSVPPCDEPCPKILKCGHNCIGFCGDPCPRLCKICDSRELIEEFYMGYEDEDGARFVVLEDCGHIIESYGMDMWLASNNDEITIKCCPKCKQPLVNTRRYSDYMKTSMKNIISVKNKYYGSFEKNVHDGRGHIAKLETLYNRTSLKLVCPSVSTLYKLFSTQLKPVKNQKRQMLSKLTVDITNSKILVLENICDLYDKAFERNETASLNSINETASPKCLEYIKFLLNRLIIEKDRMTQQEVDDYGVELKRLRRMIHFSLIQQRLPSHKLTDKLYIGLDNEIYHNGPYNVENDNNIKTQLVQLSRPIGTLDISESELKQIIAVVGVKSGAWYKCPNGHPYAIGECGGGMEMSKCPDCGANIGGHNHALTSGNAHSSIDGSRHAAWSEQANLANYELNI